MPTNDEIRENVRKRYASAATEQTNCCGSGPDTQRVAIQLGYSEDLVSHAPADANLGLGCGNPIAIASLKPGELVVDLGSGAGFDCFLAAQAVGERGRVIGVDMTPEMIMKARKNAKDVNAANVEFRLGEIEHLPVEDNSADVVISNCVINLSPDKPQVFRDAFRVLKPGGRLAISDVVLRAALPEKIRRDFSVYYAKCVSGAATVDELQTMIRSGGFIDIAIKMNESSREFIKDWSTEIELDQYIASSTIEARKPL